jgi:hypothetical protein
MTLKVLAVAAALAAGAAFASHVTPAAAVPAAGSQQSVVTDGSSLVEQVHRRRYWRYPGRCFAWRHECADRWGWGTWRFERCLARHGCGW